MASVTTRELEEPAAMPVKRGDPAWNLALLFPRQGAWTEADYLELDTNRLVELSDGCLEVLPMPNEPHQWIVRFLFRLLDEFVQTRKLGEVYFAPLPVRLWSGKFREPDIVFVRPERERTERRIPAGADLVVEVVSEGEPNRERDLSTKPDEYAKAGIPEYWIVDPELEQITVLTLDDEQYRQHGCFGIDDEASSVLLDGFSVAVRSVFDVPNKQSR